jgi:predicted nucleic acid-binding Zn ribbon protein
MPLYEYSCVKHGHRTSQIRSIMTPIIELETSVCTEEGCDSPAELVPSRIGRPILVGSGFHINDYAHGKLGS